MHRNKQIALVLADTLCRIGLQSLLTDYFAPVEVTHFTSFAELAGNGNETFDYYFTQPAIFAANLDFFLPRRSKTILLQSGTTEQPATNPVTLLATDATQETIIEQLQQLFAADAGSSLANGETNKELSAREIDVLQQIVRGITNKEIADHLNISLNTVLTHRKNITAKLGIKTVSGLTFYAIMNGILSGEEFGL